MAESKTEKQKVQEITEKLEQGIKELFESEKYKTYLNTIQAYLESRGAWTTEIGNQDSREYGEYHLDVRYNTETDELIDMKERKTVYDKAMEPINADDVVVKFASIFENEWEVLKITNMLRDDVGKMLKDMASLDEKEWDGNYLSYMEKQGAKITLLASSSKGLNGNMPDFWDYEWEDEQADIVSGKRIDVDFLNYTPELRDTPKVQDALKKLIAAFPEKEVTDRETKEQKIQALAAELDKLSYEIDTYGYRDSVSDRESQIQMIADDIRTGNVKPLSIFLQASIDEGIDEDSERQAKELLVKLAEYKPLAKIEELEELNYNMIDERLNNGVEKFNREEEKKEQAEKPQVRTSLKERLAAKQKEVAQGKKDSKEQEKSKNTHREM